MTVGSRARMLMSMRAVIERNSTATSDAYGQPEAPAWAILATVACRVWSRTRAVVEDGRKIAHVEEIRCAMASGTDVTENDRLASVQDRQGNVLWAGPLFIRAIQAKHTHVEMNLSRVQS